MLKTRIVNNVRSKSFLHRRRVTPLSSISSSPGPATLDVLVDHQNASMFVPSLDACSVKLFVIDFVDLGFTSWIVEPRRYAANFCEGQCQSQFGLQLSYSSCSQYDRRQVSMSMKLVSFISVCV
ncbi:unnamed protein product [Didymodactylos carnosus]|uniref:TGF-beta family profile domain-containing protein n=1 Tax=Didymodactylos carnosus TaxID=1234261 RepID=A0A814ZTB8_9BILA|nr:unnamed protein product [Didymodactylos carnosus]CAF1248122.1 unnamed protein product [Didymodactylos carnosus]CAF3555817.1 unnamed protein product [Didymodactylos carnosus]CAF4015471.1 unnamed protein product [Didymodactylos carnosus]